MRPYEQAQEILGLEVLPFDARERIDALYEQSDEFEQEAFFPMIYEGLMVLENENAPPR